MYNLNPDYSKIGFSAALYLPSRDGVNRICVGRYLKGTAAKQICSHLWAAASGRISALALHSGRAAAQCPMLSARLLLWDMKGSTWCSRAWHSLMGTAFCAGSGGTGT